ncbi:hypothetical protein MCOR25_005326 [Pyricularia grisea]|nr:hypothetical protein MCOR25_005326 [Pyricularia grisea]
MRVSSIAYVIGLLATATNAAPEGNFESTLAKREEAFHLAARALYDHIEANEHQLGKRASYQIGNGCISRTNSPVGVGAIYKRDAYDEDNYGGGYSGGSGGGGGMGQQGGGGFGGMGQQNGGGFSGMGQQGGGFGMGQQGGGFGAGAVQGTQGISKWDAVRRLFRMGKLKTNPQSPKTKSNFLYCIAGTQRHNQLAQTGGQGSHMLHNGVGMNNMNGGDTMGMGNNFGGSGGGMPGGGMSGGGMPGSGMQGGRMGSGNMDSGLYKRGLEGDSAGPSLTGGPSTGGSPPPQAGSPGSPAPRAPQN